MKTIGIIGGLGPEATTDYYKEIIKRCNEINPNNNLSYPEIIIYSVNMAKFLSYMEKADYVSATNYIRDCILKLKSAGADFAAISANTPHQLFHEIQKQCELPLISIVETAKDEAKRLNVKKVGLIGTVGELLSQPPIDRRSGAGREIRENLTIGWRNIGCLW